MELMTIESSSCDCCDEQTHHIPLEMDAITYDPGAGFTLHLTTEELVTLMEAGARTLRPSINE